MSVSMRARHGHIPTCWYRGAYSRIRDAAATEDAAASFELVERFVRESKIHRCILNEETKYLKESVELASKKS